jgi:ubiquinone/menaquinone biosynthesis C-methylase UbiE
MTTRQSTSSSLYAKYAVGAAENYERHFVPAIGMPFAQRLLASAGLTPGERVLDVACGTGVVARLAAEAVGREGTVAGLDPTPGMLELARSASPDGIDWYEAPAETMPLSDASFDVVLCSMGLQFFEDKVQGLREMRRVLVPGGRAVVSTPGPTPPLLDVIGAALADHVGPEASRFVHAVFSLHDPTEARELFAAAGFDSVEVETGAIALRVAPPADFLWQYVQSTPLAAVTAAMDDVARAALEHDVVERCQPFVDGDATVVEPGVLVVTGHRIGS